MIRTDAAANGKTAVCTTVPFMPGIKGSDTRKIRATESVSTTLSTSIAVVDCVSGTSHEPLAINGFAKSTILPGTRLADATPA